MNYFHTRCDILLCLDYLFDLADLSALFFSLHPSKLDMDVLRVLESVKLKSEKYPAICRWKALIQSYPQEARDRYSVTVMLRCLVNIMIIIPRTFPDFYLQITQKYVKITAL